MSVKRLEDICFDLLLKSCNLDYFAERWPDYSISMHCQINEFLTGTCQMVFYFCNCPKWGYKSGVIKLEIRLHTKIFKLVNTFNLFINVIN